MRIILILLLIISYQVSSGTSADSTRSIWKRIMPNSINMQFAGNIGMFSAGVNYISLNKRWEGNLSYGFVPAKYSDNGIHSTTVKARYIPLMKTYNPSTEVKWVNVGMWFNYAYGEKYFYKLPVYYDAGYYYFPTAANLGLTIGGEFRHDKWAIYYDFGTTDKRLINFVKSSSAIDFHEIWNISFGLSYYLK
jgi:hypothetical protein